MTAILPPDVELVDLKESVRLHCALGIRFRDSATNDVVRSGLRVKAYPAKARVGTKPVTAQVNHSGVWLCYGLPGVRMFELGAEDYLIERASPPRFPQFRIEVEDEEDRFLPCTFVAWASNKGPFEFSSHFSSPPAGTDVPLFSAPSRPVPPGCAVIRTNLVTPPTGDGPKPARWAMLQATTTVGTRITRALGLANKNGDVALMFPWPELMGLPTTTSPPGGLSMNGQGWNFQFSVWHDGKHDATGGAAEFADLDAIFAGIASTQDKLETDFSPMGEFKDATLRYGSELVVPESSAAHILFVMHH